jgi:aminomuconate-semialdehyde/2-hydroxymuconate-6-semialdehyde dehydrogenase
MKHPALRKLLPTKPGHFIDGSYTAGSSSNTMPCVAPASDELLLDLPLAGTADIDTAVQAAKAALVGPWGRTSAQERARIMRRIGDLLLERLDDFATLESLDTGKPISESKGGDVTRSARNFHFFADLAAHQSGTSYIGEDGSQHTTLREPLGVVGLITPWNLPLYLATWKLAPALAQGNSIILKPAELTPLTAMALGTVLNDAGLPPGVVNIVQGLGPHAAGEALVKHQDVKAISFTGETTTGVAIMGAAAPSLKKLSFELGGKGATVVFADADLAKAAKTAVRAAFRNQGQICLAGSRLLIARSVLPQMMDLLLREIRQIRIGDPLDPAATMGSLIAKSHRDKVAQYVEHARTLPGVEIIAGGMIPEGFPSGAYFAPTLITGVAQDSRLIQEEIFGPVLTVQTFDDLGEAMAMLNGTPYGLSCSIFTSDVQLAQQAARMAKMGLVWINDWFLRDLHTAFGGMKRSGVGREGGQYSLDFFSEFKTVTFPAPAPL